jgi:regulator of sirC expression with transglutaminase-like and TPR domain
VDVPFLEATKSQKEKMEIISQLQDLLKPELEAYQQQKAKRDALDTGENWQDLIPRDEKVVTLKERQQQIAQEKKKIQQELDRRLKQGGKKS